jgi:glutamate 5-kinase
LPAGVKEIRGTFSRGDTVSVVGGDGHEIARGLVAYDSADASRIKGRKSSRDRKGTGLAGRDELIHRDDLVMMAGSADGQ